MSPLTKTLADTARRMVAAVGSLQLRDLIALYAAVLSTWIYLRGSRSVVRVRLDNYTAIEGDGPGGPFFVVSITNRSPHVVVVEHLEIFTATGSDARKKFIHGRSSDAPFRFPLQIAPRTKTNLPLPYEELSQEGLRRVTVHLATGERIKSNRLRRAPLRVPVSVG